MTDVLDELAGRGLIALTTDEEALRTALGAGPVAYYCGFDPTASSLHAGNLLQFMVLRSLQRSGHQPIVLIGGATGLIGDPNPNSERVLNDRATVEEWVARIREQVSPFLEQPATEDPTLLAPIYVNNLDWTAALSTIDFLRDIGQHFRVAKMLAKEAVSARLNSTLGINYTEFSYQVLQGMDFLELFRRHGCVLQTGGSDQWGNLTAGVDLIHRVEGVRVHALATPLVTKADGQKFGKTESGTIWLDPTLTSPYAFFQFWLNADDGDIRAWLPMFSERPAPEIEKLLLASSNRPGERTAQRALARELTNLVHGERASQQAEAAGLALFGAGVDLTDLDPETMAAVLAEIGLTELDGSTASLATLLQSAGLASSLSQARRTVWEGGAYLNNRRIADPDAVPAEHDWIHGRFLVLRRGKRQVAGICRA
ncbi:MAG: tyrosine--tRNA ligase [Actinomycetota bacterium]|nr:tyrosine--tRNA ligase [Actinomycetota bacterium]